MAGFGKGPVTGKSGGAVPKRPPLKAKRQWDRFTDLARGSATTTTVEVGARKDAGASWLTVGQVRVEGDAVAAAVARQRSLIAEHGKRLHLALKQVGKAPLQVGYRASPDEQFIPISRADETELSDAAFGFEGTADPDSGFYCHYAGGRLVQSGSAAPGAADAGNAPPSPKAADSKGVIG